MDMCSIRTCNRLSRSRGCCAAHYLRWWKHGDPNRGGPIRATLGTANAALDDKTAPRGDCLVWTGNLDRAGYGLTKFKGKTVYVHRYAWERANGPIPEGMEVNHRCWTRACVNVDHLDLATRSQNQTYRMGPDADRTTPEGRGIVRRVLKSGESRYDTKYQHTYYGTFPTEAEAIEHITRVRASIVGEQFAGR